MSKIKVTMAVILESMTKNGFYLTISQVNEYLESIGSKIEDFEDFKDDEILNFLNYLSLKITGMKYPINKEISIYNLLYLRLLKKNSRKLGYKCEIENVIETQVNSSINIAKAFFDNKVKPIIDEFM